MIAFLLILGVAFYATALLLIDRVGDYLFERSVQEQTSVVQDLSVRFANDFERANIDALYTQALQTGAELGGRLIIIDMDGKVQLDTYRELTGQRMPYPEVISILRGQELDYGFRLQQANEVPSRTAIFDRLRRFSAGETWVGYFTAALVGETGRNIGALLFVVSVQDMVDTLRVIQDQMLLIFMLAVLAVFVTSLVFTRVITKPIGALTEGIKRMSAGDFSSRVKASGVDEISRLGETFNQMSERLENLDTSRNEFISNASHELKTPLATMKILLESMLYQEDMAPALRAEFLTDINKELDRLSNIVTDLLTLVQADAHEYKPVRKQVMLRELVEEVLRSLRPLSQEKGQTITLQAQTGALLFADPVKVRQIIYNLVDNAIKYTPKGGKVRVTVRQEGKRAVLEVADNGPGIPHKDQPHIFERFYRVDRARSRATGGNGLGLSIVRQAVMMHGGTISVQSEEGQGAIFRVDLPLAL